MRQDSGICCSRRRPRIHAEAITVPANTLTAASSAAEKIALFRSLFAGRTDVFPVRWENSKKGRSGYAPACANEWVKGICGKPHVKCGECPNQAFIPVSDNVIASHLRGGDSRGRINSDFVAGVYPLLFDETCWFLAVDFDGESWTPMSLPISKRVVAKGVPAALERSRSGNGGHIWIFFTEPIPAREARRLGACLSPRPWNAGRKSAFNLMIVSSRVRTRCQSVVSAI